MILGWSFPPSNITRSESELVSSPLGLIESNFLQDGTVESNHAMYSIIKFKELRQVYYLWLSAFRLNLILHWYGRNEAPQRTIHTVHIAMPCLCIVRRHRTFQYWLTMSLGNSVILLILWAAKMIAFSQRNQMTKKYVHSCQEFVIISHNDFCY